MKIVRIRISCLFFFSIVKEISFSKACLINELLFNIGDEDFHIRVGKRVKMRGNKIQVNEKWEEAGSNTENRLFII